MVSHMLNVTVEEANFMSIIRWARARRLARAPLRLLLWPLLVNPKDILSFLPIASACLVFKALGLERYLSHFLGKLTTCYGLPLDESHVAFHIPGTRLIFPSDAGWIVAEIFFEEVYDGFFRLASNSTVLDIGAHAGGFSVKIAKRVRREGLVIAVEPDPSNFKFLIRNIRINKLRNVIPVNVALAEKTGKVKLYLGRRTYTPSITRPTNRCVEVRAETLDSVVRRLKLRRVDFIKIDAEGAELEILKSGEDTLKSNGLKLSIATYHTPSEACDITEFLKAKGFAVWSLDARAHYLYAIKHTKQDKKEKLGA